MAMVDHGLGSLEDDMIFGDALKRLRPEVAAAVDQLFAAAWKNQSHPQDLLLLIQNGHHNTMIANGSARSVLKLSPYLIGVDEPSLAMHTFYEYLNWYRRSHCLDSAHANAGDREDPELAQFEELTIQIEAGIYLRFWEADHNLKRYHQLCAIATGSGYDWSLVVPPSRRGEKGEFIRKKLRDRIKAGCPLFHALLCSTYNSQLRNAFAHSQHYVRRPIIGLTNYDPSPKAYAPLRQLNFADWSEMFHRVVLLHNETVRALQQYDAQYKEAARANGNSLDVRITDENGSQSFKPLGVEPNGRWNWTQNMTSRG